MSLEERVKKIESFMKEKLHFKPSQGGPSRKAPTSNKAKAAPKKKAAKKKS